ncbi:MAG: hypothetical protein PVI30_24605 [Myxococcales bacterium]|jgi:hypothetical protein
MDRLQALTSLLVAATLTAATARAEDAPWVGDAVRIGLETAPVAITSVTTEADGVEVNEKVTSVGLGPTYLGVNVGGGTGGALSVGTRLYVLHNAASSEVDGGGLGGTVSSDGSSTELGIFPYLEGRFGEDMTQGFVAPMVGVAVDTRETDDESATTTTTLFGLGLMVGMHAFVNEHLSIDPAMSFVYQTGSSEVEIDGRQPEELDASGWQLAVLVGVTGWLGTDSGPRGSPSESWESPAASPRWTPPAPRPARPPSTAAAGGSAPATSGVLARRAALGDLQVIYLGQPEVDPRKVALRFTAPLRRDDRYEACESVAVEVDGQKVELGEPTYRRRDSSFGGRRATRESLQVTTDIQLFVNMAQGRDVRFDVCGQTIGAEPKTRTALMGFLLEQRRRAEPGTIPEQPAPLPTPAAATEGAEAPDGTEATEGEAAPETEAEPEPAEDPEAPSKPADSDADSR